MEFREFAWAQQLYRQRLIYGPAAEATEKSYPKYPAAALRELVRQSKHPHNLEPLLLTLRRPPNADTRKRFAELAGELVLVERVLSEEVICEDLQVVVGNRVEQTPDGMLYPDKTSQVPFETWVRVEMLDALTTMLEEGVVRSLNPVMQAKLVGDLLERSRDGARDALLRGYAMRAAHAASLSFNAVRADVAKPAAGGGGAGASAYALAAVAALRLATGAGPERERAEGAAATGGVGAGGGSSDSDGEAGVGASKDGAEPASKGAGGGALTNPYSADPFERLKLLSAACQALYLSAAGAEAGVAAAPAAAEGGGRGSVLRLVEAQRLPDVSQLAALGAAPLLARAVEAAAAALADRRAAASAAAAAGAVEGADGGVAEGEEGEASATERAAAGELPFEENWQEFLKANLAGDMVPREASLVAALAGALLQLLSRAPAGGAAADANGGGPTADANGGGAASNGGRAAVEERAWPSAAALELLAAEGGAAAGAALLKDVAEALLAGPGDENAAAIVALPSFAALVGAALARRCCHCSQREEPSRQLKRCGACAKAFYCSEKCQRAAWSAGHKQVCKQLAK